jgi:hypothetical protein
MSIREFCPQRRLRESQVHGWQHHLEPGRQHRLLCRPGLPEGAAGFALMSVRRGDGCRDGVSGVRRSATAYPLGVDEKTLGAILAALEPSRS